MAVSTGFEKHLFISYAHIDNKPLTEGQKGWVSRFHESLEAMLSMRLGRHAAIWRDQKLAGNDLFAEEIVSQFPTTALMISVLTPRYLESDWCTREVQEFCSVATQRGGVVVQNKSRIIKVIKTPVDNEGTRLPTVLRGVKGYPFFVQDDAGAPLELDPAYGDDMASRFNVSVATLAWDIAQQIKHLTSAAPTPAAAAVPSPGTPVIYLAECSWDRRQAREALEADLKLHGYTVLPDRELPREEAAYVAEVARLLEQAKLSIHLVGSNYGAVPDGPTQRSVVVLQNDAAIARSRSAGLRRVIGLPEGTTSAQAEQQRFLEALQKDADTQFGADLVIADLETLKNAVHAALARLETPAAPAAPVEGSGDGAKAVYVICVERDRKATIPLRQYLKAQGFEAQIPIFDGDAAAVRRYHEDVLSRCDAVILFYGVGEESWRRSVDTDLKKMKGLRRDKRLLASHTYLAEPATAAKQDLIEMEEPHLINGLDGFSEAAMTPLVESLKKA